jgi:hypothetical protein
MHRKFSVEGNGNIYRKVIGLNSDVCDWFSDRRMLSEIQVV